MHDAPGDKEEKKRCMMTNSYCAFASFLLNLVVGWYLTNLSYSFDNQTKILAKSTMVKISPVSAAIIIGAASTSAFVPTNSPSFVNKQISTSTQLEAAPTMVIY